MNVGWSRAFAYAGLALALAVFAGRAQAESYAVVVNADNAAAKALDDPRAYVKSLFLKQQTQWPDGTPALPLDRRDGSPARESFLAEVLQMSQEDLDRHWLRLKQTRGETPPRQVGSALILYRQITRERGSLSVISAAELDTAPIEVEVLFEFER